MIRRRPVSLLALLACAAGLVYVIGAASSQDAAARDAQQAARFAAALEAGQLDTPAAFQAACGTAQHQLHQAGQTILTYHGGDLWIRTAPGQHVAPRWVRPIRVAGVYRHSEIPATAADVRTFLACKP